MSEETNGVPEWARAIKSPLDSRMGLELIELRPDRAVGRFPVEGNTQPHGIWHGGASCVLAEGLASLAASAHARTMGKVAVGLDINVTHHRSVRNGWVTGVATALSLGRTIASYEVAMTDDRGRRIATGRLTCAIIDPAAGDLAPAP